MRDNLYFKCPNTIKGFVTQSGLRSGAIDGLGEAIHFPLTKQAVLHHMVGGNEKAVGRDQKSGAQVGLFPIPFAILIFEDDLQAFRFNLGPGKLDPLSR